MQKEKIDFDTLLLETIELYGKEPWFHDVRVARDDAGSRIEIVADRDYWNTEKDSISRKYKNAYVCVLVQNFFKRKTL